MKTIDITVLLFIVLFALMAAIVVMVVINVRKRRREAEEKWQCRKAELDARLREEEKEKQWLEEKGRKDEEERKRLEEEEQQKAVEEARREEDEEQKRLADELKKAEAERKRVEEEKLRRAQEEEQLLKTEKEAQERAEKEELKRLKAEGQWREEKRRKAEEERKRVKEEAQKKTKEVHGRKPLPPVKRVGRPRSSTKQQEMEKTPGIKPSYLKPEIVCWNEGWRWIVGIEIPEELETLSVVQNEKLLAQDTIDESLYRLRHAVGRVKVTWTGGQKDILLLGAGRNYFIFKMRKDWKGLGRLVRHPTIGYYLAIVPREWKRDEEVSGSASVNPESVQVDGYKAHFFCQEQDGNKAIGFINANGERIQVESGYSRFQIVGREIEDASEDMGPLFGEQLPRIQTLDEKGWRDIGVIVLGEEGMGKNRWRTQFVPQVGAKEQKLPEEIANRRGGWYFVRIYDNGDNLLESMDFRFLKVLNDIRIESSDFLPNPNGYDNVRVQFLHQTDCKVELMDDDAQHALEIYRESGQTIVTVPPKPNCDKTHWILCDGDAKIKVTVLVERIWWSFGVMGVATTDWVDRPITLFHKHFTATSDKALFVRLPRLRFVRKIDVGFDRNKSKPYQVEVEKKEIAIPLRDFCDTEEIENRQEEFDIKIWVQSEETKAFKAVIVKVHTDQTIPIQKTWIGYGRKKAAVAKAVLREGPGEFIVNNEPVWMYFKGNSKKAKCFLRRLLELDKINPLIKKMEIDIKVIRSKPKSNRQIKAVTHAIARAFMCYDPRLKRFIKEKGFGGARVKALSVRKKQFTRNRYRNL